MGKEIHDYKFKFFQPENIRPNSVIVFIGGRNTGKSFCMRDIMYFHRDIPIGILVCPTNKFNGNFTGTIPEGCIYDIYPKERIEKLFQLQLNRANKLKRDPVKYGDLDRRVIIALDDMGFNREWQKDQRILEIMMNGRHPEITLFISLQYALTLPPKFRTNFDYIFLFKHTMKSEKFRLFQYFGGMFDNFNDFEYYLNKMTEDYGCMVIDMRSRTNDISDIVYYYKAKDRGPYRMLHDRLWNDRLCEQRLIEKQVKRDTKINAKRKRM